MKMQIHILLTLMMLAMPAVVMAQLGFDVASVEAYIADHKNQRSLLLARATLEQSNNLLHEYSAKAAEDYKVLNFDLDKYTRAFDVIDVLYQSLRSENVSLLQDIVTGETNYWFRSWSDSTGRGGRRSALYDKDGNEVMAFDGEQSATIQNGLLVLQESRMVGDSYDVDYDSYGTCSVIDLATGKNLPVPEGAYSCIVCGDALVFNCYARPADLAADEWDDDPSLHSWVTVQQKDGTQTYGSSTSTASRISYEPDELDDWVELDISHADGSPVDQVLHNPATGEGLRGYRQTCGHGTAAFLTPSGTYQLRDLTTEDRGRIRRPAQQLFPGVCGHLERGQ